MPLNKQLLTEAIRRMGPADIFIDPTALREFRVDDMINIGTLEGERRGEIEYSNNALTMPEHTGEIPHDVMASVSRAAITATVVLNAQGAELYPRINPLGSNAGGSSSFRRKPTFGVLLIPHSELGKSIDYVAGAWQRIEDDGEDTEVNGGDAIPNHALWLWKAHVSHGGIPYTFEDGGKSRVEVTWEGMFDDTKPEGAKVFLIGDPYQFSTPIPVLP